MKTPRSLILLLSLTFSLMFPVLANASGLQAKVVEILDGDTILVQNVNRQLKIKFRGVDAPEKDQPYGDVARQHLSDLVLGKIVLVDFSAIGNEKDLVAKVYLDKMDVGQQVIRDGVAWFDKEDGRELSAPERNMYAQSEEAARSERRGIWQDAQPTPPWEWRQRATLAKQIAAAPPDTIMQPVISRPATSQNLSRASREEMEKEALLRSILLKGGNPIPASSISVDPKTGLIWRKIEPEGEPFSALAPGVSFDFSAIIPIGKGQDADAHYVIGRQEKAVYFLAWASGPNQGHTDADFFEDEGSGFLAGIRREFNAHGYGFSCDLSEWHKVSQPGYHGREYSFEGCTISGVLRLYTKLKGNERHLYLLGVLNNTADDAQAKKFLNSFTLKK
ncbi:MAG: thermonuclease family protein [Pyrinomonadaceae bacterium]